ncbi:MAG: hypothetical protein OEW19_15035 [Acidobacteriota bacterium]|nr:hypothetical protein [Acidobacteriota bacterium]
MTLPIELPQDQRPVGHAVEEDPHQAQQVPDYHEEHGQEGEVGDRGDQLINDN